MSDAEKVVSVLLEMGEFYDYFHRSSAINRRFSNIALDVFRENGLTHSEFEILYAVKQGAKSQRDLVNCGINPSQLSRYVVGLESKGLITSAPGLQNSRNLVLTERGSALTDTVENRLEQLSSQLISRDQLPGAAQTQSDILSIFKAPWTRHR